MDGGSERLSPPGTKIEHPLVIFGAGDENMCPLGDDFAYLMGMAMSPSPGGIENVSAPEGVVKSTNSLGHLRFCFIFKTEICVLLEKDFYVLEVKISPD